MTPEIQKLVDGIYSTLGDTPLIRDAKDVADALVAADKENERLRGWIGINKRIEVLEDCLRQETELRDKAEADAKTARDIERYDITIKPIYYGGGIKQWSSYIENKTTINHTSLLSESIKLTVSQVQ